MALVECGGVPLDVSSSTVGPPTKLMLMALIAWKLGENMTCETRGVGSTSPKGGYWAVDVRGRQRRCHHHWSIVSNQSYREMLYIYSPVLLADNGGKAPSLGLDVLAAPGLHQVVVMLAAQLLLLCMINA